MASAIVHVLDHPPNRRRLRDRAAEFSEANAIDRYVDVLRDRVEAAASRSSFCFDAARP